MRESGKTKISKKILALTLCLSCGLAASAAAADNIIVNDKNSPAAVTFVDGKRGIFIGKDQGYTTKSWVGEVLAIGYGGYGKQDAIAGETVILGNASGGNARGATVVGQRAGTNGENTTVIGSSASANSYSTSTTGSVALGSYSDVRASEAEALGYFSKVDFKVDRGVALGARSKATVKAGEKGYLYKESDGNDTAWVSKMGAVAVGSEDDGNRQITNVAAGTKDDDAVNVAQLKRIEESSTGNMAQLDSRVSSLNSDVKRVGAMSAALAGLNPIASNDGTKWNVAVAGGSYKGEKAMALGAFYTPNRNSQFSVGSTVGQNSTMFNVGASFKVGPASAQPTSVNQGAIKSLTREVESLKAQHESDQARIAALEAKVNALASK